MGWKEEISELGRGLEEAQDKLLMSEHLSAVEVAVTGLGESVAALKDRLTLMESRHNALFSENPLDPMGAISELRQRVSQLEYLRGADVAAHEALREAVSGLEKTVSDHRSRLQSVDGIGVTCDPLLDARKGELHEIGVALGDLEGRIEALEKAQAPKPMMTFRRYGKLGPSTDNAKAADDFLESRGLPRVAPELGDEPHPKDLNEVRADFGLPPVGDPWTHRSEKMRCRTCMWFTEKVVKPMPPHVVPGESSSLRILGRCRRHAPTMSGYPAVYTDDWCGDHKLDEAKA